jgi:pimeloyl-ACP methyl ester carboxylesterase
MPNNYEICHEFVKVNGIRMHYVTMGHGPLIVLLHGFPEFWYSWRHQISSLSKQFKVVAPDMRGYGETEKPVKVDAYKIEKIVKDIVELVQGLGYEKATIAGHDWGGIIAWSIAMMAPDVVEKLIIMNAPHPGVYSKRIPKNIKQMLRSWYVFFFQIKGIPELILRSKNYKILKSSLLNSLVRKECFTEKDIETYVSSWKSGGISGGINYYRANLSLRYWLNSNAISFPKIKVPVLHIWAEGDKFLGKELTKNTQEFIDAQYRLHLIPNCGHWIQQEASDEVNGVMIKFLEGALN